MNSSGTIYSQSNTTYTDGYNFGYATTNTTLYSPALQQIQLRQNAEDMSQFQDEQLKEWISLLFIYSIRGLFF